MRKTLTAIAAGIVAFMGAPNVSLAQSPEIIGYEQDGTLTFTSAGDGHSFTLEFTSDLEAGSWTNWSAVTDQPITGQVMSLPTPMYFRVKVKPQPVAGTIRWSGSDFEGFMGGSWVSLSRGSLDTHYLGKVCAAAADVSAESFPFQLSGVFDDDPVSPNTCDTSLNNAAWFSYTAPATAEYRVTLSNATPTTAYSRLAIFEGGACDPLGAQLTCTATDADWILADVSFVTGETYLIVFWTDGEESTMVDPSIWIQELSGHYCGSAADVSSVAFPYQLTGNFTEDQPGGSCDLTANNTVWFTYTPTETRSYRLVLQNHTPLTHTPVLPSSLEADVTRTILWWPALRQTARRLATMSLW